MHQRVKESKGHTEIFVNLRFQKVELEFQKLVKIKIKFRKGSTRQYQPYSERMPPVFLVFEFLKIQDFAGGSPQTCYLDNRFKTPIAQGFLLTVSKLIRQPFVQLTSLRGVTPDSLRETQVLLKV